jgi:hypothetical protein
MPLPGLLYAQVGKSYRRRRLVGVTHRVVFGTMQHVKEVLAECGRQINTAFVERLNLDIRQRGATVGRRVDTLCQDEDGLQHQLAVYHVYYNFVLPHSSLRQPLLVPEPTKGTGSAKVWRPCTPAMAAGLTAHVWTLREELLFRVPPWPQPQVRQRAREENDRATERDRPADKQASRQFRLWSTNATAAAGPHPALSLGAPGCNGERLP